MFSNRASHHILPLAASSRFNSQADASRSATSTWLPLATLSSGLRPEEGSLAEERTWLVEWLRGLPSLERSSWSGARETRIRLHCARLGETLSGSAKRSSAVQGKSGPLTLPAHRFQVVSTERNQTQQMVR